MIQRSSLKISGQESSRSSSSRVGNGHSMHPERTFYIPWIPAFAGMTQGEPDAPLKSEMAANGRLKQFGNLDCVEGSAFADLVAAHEHFNSVTCGL